MGSFKDKVILVTGGSSGIGYAAVKKFVMHGANVITCGRDKKKGLNAVELIRKEFKRDVDFMECDIGNQQEIESLFEHIVKTYSVLDIAVNNAAIVIGGKLLHEYSHEEFNLVMSTNLTGTFMCMKKELEIMLRSSKGSIVNIASNTGIRANKRLISPYIVSKHGIVGLTRVAALEYADKGIRVNAVLPGGTETDMLANLDELARIAMINNSPMKRLIDPSEIADSILFLASDEAGAITGVMLPVDCGKMAST